MKYKHILTLGLALALSLSVVTTSAAAQSDMHKASPAAAPSEAQKSFDAMKMFAGEWDGPVTVPEMPEMKGGAPMHASLRVTSRGNAVVHEFQEANTPIRSRCFMWMAISSI
jgi:hypothetical protein